MSEAKDIVGRIVWDSIHAIAATYDRPEKKQAFVNMIYSYVGTFPCDKCRANLRRHLASGPPSNGHLPLINSSGEFEDRWFRNNITLFTWTFQLHNIVNREIGKPEMAWSDAEARWGKLLYNKKHCSECDL